MFLFVPLSKFFTRLSLVPFMQHSCRTRIVCVALVSHLCRARVARASSVLHLYCIRVVRIALVSLVSGTHVVNQTRSHKITLLHVIAFHLQKQPTRGVLRKRCSENMQQVYRRTPMSKCDFNKAATQLNFPHIFRAPFYRNTSGELLLHLLIKSFHTNISLYFNDFLHYVKTPPAITCSKITRYEIW